MQPHKIITDRQNTRRQVPVKDRLDALPRHFGRWHLSFEFTVFRFMDSLSPDYDGGYWEFYDLENGGFYMAPVSDTPFLIQCRGNHFFGTLSPDAAGITACLFALSHLAFDSGEDTDIFTEKFHQLRVYAYEHPEADLIINATD